MAQTVLTPSKSVIDQMEKHYQSCMQTKKPQGSLFFVKVPGCAITAYRSGKVLFQGNAAEEEASKWGNQKSNHKKQQRTTGSDIYTPPEDIAHLSIIGSDEVGTGDYFGPMTVAAVFIASNQLQELQQIGLKDSKLLKDWQIYDLAEIVKPQVTYKLLTLDNPKYNRLREKGMTQGKMKALLHNQALLQVTHELGNTAYDGILIDQFAKPALYFKHLAGQTDIVRKNVFFSTKAESIHLSVAAASIIARQAFLDEMHHLSERAEIDLPKGAGPPVDKAAARLIREKGGESLQQFAKVHFSNTEKAKHLSR